CGTSDKKVAAVAPAAVPTTSLPKFKGSATVNKIEADVSVANEGEWTVAFLDAAGDDLPAATVSNVALESAGTAIPLHINDTGEGWTGSGPLPQGAAAK